VTANSNQPGRPLLFAGRTDNSLTFAKPDQNRQL
jgi:hypothetical protein